MIDAEDFIKIKNMTRAQMDEYLTEIFQNAYNTGKEEGMREAVATRVKNTQPKAQNPLYKELNRVYGSEAIAKYIDAMFDIGFSNDSVREKLQCANSTLFNYMMAYDIVSVAKRKGLNGIIRAEAEDLPSPEDWIKEWAKENSTHLQSRAEEDAERKEIERILEREKEQKPIHVYGSVYYDCPVCNKRFGTGALGEKWPFRSHRAQGRGGYLCSWGCHRKMEQVIDIGKEIKRKKKLEAVV